MKEEREYTIRIIKEAQCCGVRQSKACEILGISAKTLQRWDKLGHQEDGRLSPKHKPKSTLSDLERQRILSVCNEPEYASLPANKIVAKLADKGIYIASESTIYRVLRQERQLTHRISSKPARKVHKPEALVATGPNQVYSWDITYLPTSVKGLFYYLYLVMDVYSRKIVGWQVHDRESSDYAAEMMKAICQEEAIQRDQVILHSDNGSPMKGATMLATLQQLGIMPSYSRPSVSNDNPYSERLFRTLKYCPDYPEKAFASLIDARSWVSHFVYWYNHEHLHSSIRYVTPVQRHNQQDKDILEQRKSVYESAKKRHPERWSGDIRNWQPITEVYLNPGKNKDGTAEKQAT